MPVQVHTIRRGDLLPNGVVTFEAAGVTCLVADVDGDVRAYAVGGPISPHLGRAAVADGSVLCPLHGWPIDPDGTGRGCGTGRYCRYDPLPVETDEHQIRVSLTSI